MVAEGSVFKRCSCVSRRSCPKLRRADGAWNPRHGHWFYQLELPPGQDGRRRTLRRRPAAVADTRDAAVAERDEARFLLGLAGRDAAAADQIAGILLRVPRGQPLPDTVNLQRLVTAGALAGIHLTAGEYLTVWIADRTMDDNTRRQYAGHIKNHLVPHLGGLRLDRLNADDIENMFRAINDRNQQILDARHSSDRQERAAVRGVRTTGLSTQHKILATLRKALNDAIRKRHLITQNAATHVDLPTLMPPKARFWTHAALEFWYRTGKPPSSVMVWTPAQAHTFLTYVQSHDPDLYPIFALIVFRGPRRGEAAGIRTDQIDTGSATAIFTHQLTLHGTQPVYKRVKSRAGDRIVALDRFTNAAITAYAARRERLARLHGRHWPEEVRVREYVPGTGYTTSQHDLFFRQPDGQAWHPDTISDRWYDYIDASGVPPCRLHDGRHASASYTHAAGGNVIDIKHQLGVSTSEVAADIYPAPLEANTRRLAEATADLVFNAAPFTARLPRPRTADDDTTHELRKQK